MNSLVGTSDMKKIKDMNGRIKYQGEFEEPVRTMIPTGSKSNFILATRESIDTLVLK